MCKMQLSLNSVKGHWVENKYLQLFSSSEPLIKPNQVFVHIVESTRIEPFSPRIM